MELIYDHRTESAALAERHTSSVASAVDIREVEIGSLEAPIRTSLGVEDGLSMAQLLAIVAVVAIATMGVVAIVALTVSPGSVPIG